MKKVLITNEKAKSIVKYSFFLLLTNQVNRHKNTEVTSNKRKSRCTQKSLIVEGPTCHDTSDPGQFEADTIGKTSEIGQVESLKVIVQSF